MESCVKLNLLLHGTHSAVLESSVADFISAVIRLGHSSIVDVEGDVSSDGKGAGVPEQPRHVEYACFRCREPEIIDRLRFPEHCLKEVLLRASIGADLVDCEGPVEGACNASRLGP